MLNKFFIIAIMSVFFLSACQQNANVRPDDAPVVDHSGTANGSDTTPGGANSSGLPGGGVYKGDPLDNPASPLATRTIYFDYDSSEIRSDFQESILAHGQYLAEHPDASITLEGHSDERGSREYNIGLGERRAQAVRRLLLFQGAADKQVMVVSYGEEKPVLEGHDEASYSKNRRVEIVYKR